MRQESEREQESIGADTRYADRVPSGLISARTSSENDSRIVFAEIPDTGCLQSGATSHNGTTTNALS